jgi:hypothetical protein
MPAWINFDLLVHEASFFASDPDELVREVFKAAFNSITATHKAHQERLQNERDQTASFRLLRITIQK